MTTKADKATSESKLVLASASPARQRMLENAGLEFTAITAEIDESSIRDRLLSESKTPAEIAAALAGAKAEDVASRVGATTGDGPLVIGADQILLFAGKIFEKPGDRAAARDTLKRLRGNTHQLISAVTGYRAGGQVWSCCESARLTMHDFSDDYLEAYLRRDEGQLSSVGAYRIEGRGVQLFSHIEGDFFTIQGLPLLPLLQFLRREKLLPA